MAKRRLLIASAGLVAMMACVDRPGSTGPEGAAAVVGAEAAARPERLARLFAHSLRDAAFRAYVKAQLDASPYREHKLQFQTFLGADDGRGLRALAAGNGLSESDVAAEVAAAIPLEIYLPVPAHRDIWSGDQRLLVATALTDRDAPVAFDLAGRRQVLSPSEPPATPVLAVVPVETDFTPRPGFQLCLACEPDDTDSAPPPPSPPAGLYLTRSKFVSDFEGWLKGSPEIEAHVLGQKGASDTLMSYQCAGATRAAPYYFDQNSKEWSGSVLLFSQAQLDQYNTAHPSKNIRVFFIEDDDAACDIRTDRDRLQELFRAVDGAYRDITAGNDSSASGGRLYKRATALHRILVALASWIKSNDDPIGNAVEDDVVGSVVAGFNWVVKGDNNVTNGWVNLEMR
jgi:hypothetical protein